MRISTQTIQETGVSNMMLRQTQIHRSQEEISTGLRLLKPSDDPAGMANVLNLNAYITINTRYQQNISAVSLRLGNEDTALESAETVLNRVRELTVTGMNDSYNASDRGAIATEIGELTNALLDVGNAQNDKGEYIFSGSLAKTKPFAFDNSKTPPEISYSGDNFQRKVQIGPDIVMEDGHNGFSVFENIPTADTTVTAATTTTTSTPPADTTSATTATDGTTTASTTPDATATTPTAEATTGADTGTGTDTTTASTTTPATSATATPTRSLFNTLLKLKEIFSGQLSDADFHTATQAALKDLDAGLLSITNTRVEVGAKLSSLEQQNSILGKFILDSKQDLSNLQDADYAATISRFTLQQTALQASQQAYVKVKGLSLFNYL